MRAYYENVAGASSGTTEFFLSSDYLAGYVWLFPVGGGRYNVGLGMLSEIVAEHKVDLKETLTRVLATHPELAGRFARGPAAGAHRGLRAAAGRRAGAPHQRRPVYAVRRRGFAD